MLEVNFCLKWKKKKKKLIFRTNKNPRYKSSTSQRLIRREAWTNSVTAASRIRRRDARAFSTLLPKASPLASARSFCRLMFACCRGLRASNRRVLCLIESSLGRPLPYAKNQLPCNRDQSAASYQDLRHFHRPDGGTRPSLPFFFSHPSLQALSIPRAAESTSILENNRQRERHDILLLAGRAHTSAQHAVLIGNRDTYRPTPLIKPKKKIGPDHLASVSVLG